MFFIDEACSNPVLLLIKSFNKLFCFVSCTLQLLHLQPLILR